MAVHTSNEVLLLLLWLLLSLLLLILVLLLRELNNHWLKGAVRYETFKFIDFQKNWYIKVPGVPRSWMLWSK